MSLTLTSAVETALATGHINVVELVRVSFGNGIYRYWADRPVDGSISFDGRTYEARIQTLSSLPFNIADGDDKTTIVLDNTSFYARGLLDRGYRFHRARVAVVRQLQISGVAAEDSVIGSWTNPYWQGTITEYEMDDQQCKLSVSAGILELNRRALRKYEHSCANLFADKLYCPFDPLNGKGLPEKKFTGSATSGSATTLVDSAADFSTAQAGWLVFNVTDQSIGVVTGVATTTLTCSGGFANGSNNSVSGSDVYIVGPAFTGCTLSKGACIERGMFGPNDKQTSAQLNTDKRRYFQGYTLPAPVPFLTRYTDNDGDLSPFSNTARGNRGIAGRPVPWLFGDFRRTELDLLGWAFEDIGSEKPHSNLLFGVSQGRCHSMSAPQVSGYGPAQPARRRDAEFDGTFIVYNVNEYAGVANDQTNGIDTGELTLEQQRLGIGTRGSYAVIRQTALDTYDDNPWLFNNSAGDGVSLSGMTAVRVRIEGETLEDPRASCTVKGAYCRMFSGETQGTDNNATIWTRQPNPVQVGYHILRDTAAGAGLSDDAIDLTSWTAASAHCQARVEPTQAARADVTGTVAYGPDDGATSSGSGNFIVTDQEIPQGVEGGLLTVYTSGGPVSRTCKIIKYEPANPVIDYDGEYGDGPTKAPPAFEGEEVWKILIEGTWPVGQVPANGDLFEIFNAAQLVRFAFNGSVSKNESVAKTLKAILANCDGTYVSKNGKIAVVIPTVVDLSAIESETIFTDKGTSRNIIRRDGKSTVKWKPDDLEKVPNAVSVEFADKELFYEVTSLKIHNRAAQSYVAEVFNELRREKAEGTLSLNGTNHRDQALRLGALKLRRMGPLPGNRENGTVTFDVSIHDAQDLVPMEDVRIIQSDVLPSYLPRTFRLTNKTDNNDKLTMSLTWRPHLNAFYDDSADDLGVDAFPDPTQFPPGELPLPTKILALDDDGFTDSQGNFHERVTVNMTLPKSP